MPTIKSKLTGEEVANLPYSAQGEQTAQQMVQQDPNLEIDYSPGGQQDAPTMRESYHLGGEVPGQPGFGVNPNALSPNINPMGASPAEAMGKAMAGSRIPYSYEKGGKVKYKK